MNQPLEPSYLRYVYDHLENGSITSDNASALPQGFIGLYEQEFEANTPVHKRQKVLQQLATFALLKTAVSARFVASVLDTDEEVIEALIQNYSTWFNSPESGIYVLYHDRLRIYLLQKLSRTEVLRLNEQIITTLEKSIEAQNTDESEYYALQHLAGHMCLASQLGKEYERLHHFVNQESLWQRQIKLSKGYEWSQHAVQQGIKEGARRAHEMNTIRSTVNSVKLMTQEQNSAEDILSLLNEGDYITALKRAEIWEGDRQFKLYLLFIHELTIGTSKEADFRKEACKAVLEAIDQTPEDHSVIDWCKFYPELAIYKYHEELLKMELDGMVIWKRGKYNLKDISDWKDVDIEIIKSLASEITDDNIKPKACMEISKVLMEQGEEEEALRLVSQIASLEYKSKAYLEISRILIEQGNKELSNNTLQHSLRVASGLKDYSKSITYFKIFKFLMEHGEKDKALRIASEITNGYIKVCVYGEVSKILAKQGKIDESKIAMKESLNVASEIKNDRSKSRSYIELSKVLMEQGKKDEAFGIVSKIAYEEYKSVAFLEISRILSAKSEKKLANKTILLALRVASNLTSEITKSYTYAELSKVLMEYGEKEKALRIASDITKKKIKVYAYLEVSRILMKQGKIDESKVAMQEANRIASLITNEYWKSEAYVGISKIFLELGEMKKFESSILDSLFFRNKIIFHHQKRKLHETNSKISKILMDQGQRKSAISIAGDITHNVIRDSTYSYISRILMIKEEKKMSLHVISEIFKQSIKSMAFANISKILMNQGKMKESKETMQQSLKLSSEINDDYDKSIAYVEISKILMEQGKIQQSLKLSSEINDDYNKSYADKEISKILMEQGKIKDSLKVASEITLKLIKSQTYLRLFELLIARGENEYSKLVLQQSIQISLEIDDDLNRTFILKDLSETLLKHGNKEESLKFAFEIPIADMKSSAYIELSKIFIGQDEKEESRKAIQEAIKIAENIKEGSARINAFNYFGKMLSFKEAQNLLSLIPSEDNQSAVIRGMSENIYEQMELSEAVYPYLYHHSKYTENLSNILFHQAKIACFFEEDRNEEKLDMLSEVLDIKDWRRISA